MDTILITTIQTNIFWEDKLQNLEHLTKHIDSIQEKTDLIVLPEMFNTGFSMNASTLFETMEGNTIMWMKNIANKKKVHIMGSLIIKENNQYYNRLIIVFPNQQIAYYDKKHLFVLSKEELVFNSGNTQQFIYINNFKILLQICFDLRFPIWAAQPYNLPQYDILINVANWPTKRIYAWKHLLIGRAIENMCFVVGVNRIGLDGNKIKHAGHSMIVNPFGAVIYACIKKEEVKTHIITKKEIEDGRNKLP
ncbi:MAG: nitrilase family protein, partial [Sediminibacterium sp.]|nr:nitrilase family protein [Sediminibacterium sp.]